MLSSQPLPFASLTQQFNQLLACPWEERGHLTAVRRNDVTRNQEKTMQAMHTHFGHSFMPQASAEMGGYIYRIDAEKSPFDKAFAQAISNKADFAPDQLAAALTHHIFWQTLYTANDTAKTWGDWKLGFNKESNILGVVRLHTNNQREKHFLETADQVIRNTGQSTYPGNLAHDDFCLLSSKRDEPNSRADSKLFYRWEVRSSEGIHPILTKAQPALQEALEICTSVPVKDLNQALKHFDDFNKPHY